MLMKTRTPVIDFFYVEPQHQAIHQDLENWARYVEDRRRAGQAPIWRLGKSHGRQWHAPELRAAVDTLAGMRMEKAVYALPEKHRDAIRWCYVEKCSPASTIKRLAVTYEGLFALIRSGRTILVNRAR